MVRVHARVLRCRGHIYKVQTKDGFLQSKYGLKVSTASTNVQLRRMVKSWGTTGARSRLDTLSKSHTLTRAGGGGYAATAQAIVAQLIMCATRTAPDSSALTGVPTKRQAQATPR